MGSSSGGDLRPPAQPTPQGNIIPYGGTSPGMPGGGVPSFLPADPTAMATGLTPEMLAAINAPPPLPVMRPAMAAPAQAPNPDALRALLARLMAGNEQQSPPGAPPMGYGGSGQGGRGTATGIGGRGGGGRDSWGGLR